VTGSELTIVIALVLIAALAVGIVLGLIAARLNRAPPPEPPSEDSLLGRVQIAEAARAEAEEKLREMEEHHQRALAERQAEFDRLMKQKEAELRATMDGLGAARRSLEELQAERAGLIAELQHRVKPVSEG